MGRFNKNIIPGARFGRLVVVRRIPNEKVNGRWLNRAVFRCDCGEEVTVMISSVVSGLTKSCGCLNREKRKENARRRAERAFGEKLKAGKRYGRLVILHRVEIDGKLTDFVRCRCDCGRIVDSQVDGFRHARTRSCGCLAADKVAERNREKGKFDCISVTDPELHRAWYNVVRRCTKKNNVSYALYGAKGVRVCSYLLADPRHLAATIGQKPSKEMSVDRYPIHNGNYTCGKCEECRKNGWSLNIRWATPREQTLNRGDYNARITAFGKTLCKSEWIELSGIPSSTLSNRLNRGWSPERALTTPSIRGRYYKPPTDTDSGRTES
jgi:hypothetical protein